MTKPDKFIILFFAPISLFANPNLDLIKDKEWKGNCRKVLNEAGEEIKKQPYLRLQSSYSYQGESLIWWVKSFTDKQCKNIYNGNMYISKCEFKTKDEYANCKQIKLESTKDGKIWESKPMIDHAGYINTYVEKIKVKLINNGKVLLSSIGESEEERREVLVR